MTKSSDISVILDRSKIEGIKNVYALGCFASRVTFYSQQRRALNLIWALFEKGILKKYSSVGIVGGGLAGITAAIAARQKGCNVRIYEKSNHLMPLQVGNNSRYIHPCIYDWPQEGSQEATTSLPFLNWTAGPANDVRDQILQEWNSLSQRIDIKKNQKINLIEEVNDFPHISSQEPSRHDQFDCVIIAVGFGIEKCISNVDFKSYWSNDAIHQPILNKPGMKVKYLVSGCGDGGLIDAQRIVLSNFDHNKFTNEFIDNFWVQALTKSILKIDSKVNDYLNNNSSLNIDVFIHNEYAKLKVHDKLLKFFKSKLRDDTIVTLNSSSNIFTNYKASSLNRFVIYLLEKCGAVNYIRGKIQEVSNQKGEYLVIFNNNGSISQESFDQIIIRHGPEGIIKGLLPHHTRVPLISNDDPTNHQLWPSSFYKSTSIIINSLNSAEITSNIRNFMQATFKKRGVSAVSLEKYKKSFVICIKLDKGSKLSAKDFQAKVDGVRVKVTYEIPILPQGSFEIKHNFEGLTFGTPIGVILKEEKDFKKISWGSLGCFVKLSNGQIGLLSTNHTIARNNSARKKDVIVAKKNQSTEEVSEIGELYEFIKLDFENRESALQFDCAVASLNIGQNFINKIKLFSQDISINKVGEADFNETVYKIGAGSGLTKGRISSMFVSIKITYEHTFLHFKDVIMIKGSGGKSFSKPGDSGALVFKKDGTALGIVFAASAEYTLIYPLREALNKLNCRLLTGE